MHNVHAERAYMALYTQELDAFSNQGMLAVDALARVVSDPGCRPSKAYEAVGLVDSPLLFESWCQSLSSEQQEQVNERVKAQEAIEPYLPVLHGISRSKRYGLDLPKCAEVLADSRFADVYTIDLPAADEPVVAKIANDPDQAWRTRDALQRSNAQLALAGVRSTEDCVAVDYSGVSLSRLIEGTVTENISIDAASDISPEVVAKAVADVEAIDSQRIALDGTGNGNAMLTDEGLAFLDFGSMRFMPGQNMFTLRKTFLRMGGSNKLNQNYPVGLAESQARLSRIFTLLEP